MTADERLSAIRVKIERAKEHISDLQNRIQAFLNANPYQIGTKRNPQTRQLIYYLTSVQEPPLMLAAIAGDIVQNLRSSLDHLAFQLFLLGRKAGTSAVHVYFPIFDSPDEYKTGAPGKVKGMREDAVKAIDATKPYKGGNDTLWRLHKLSKIDKHRFLITVGSAFRSIDLGGYMHRMMQRETADNPIWVPFKNVSIEAFYRPSDTMFPLKAGDELFVDTPEAEIDQQLKFAFDVAFGEPEVVEGESLIQTLQATANLVALLHAPLRPYLASPHSRKHGTALPEVRYRSNLSPTVPVQQTPRSLYGAPRLQRLARG